MSTYSSRNKTWFEISLKTEDSNEDYVYKDYEKQILDWHRRWILTICGITIMVSNCKFRWKPSGSWKWKEWWFLNKGISFDYDPQWNHQYERLG